MQKHCDESISLPLVLYNGETLSTHCTCAPATSPPPHPRTWDTAMHQSLPLAPYDIYYGTRDRSMPTSCDISNRRQPSTNVTVVLARPRPLADTSILGILVLAGSPPSPRTASQFLRSARKVTIILRAECRKQDAVHGEGGDPSSTSIPKILVSANERGLARTAVTFADGRRLLLIIISHDVGIERSLVP
eukprot:1190541-Prorocentrum_minimum.AAC.5